MTKWKYGGYEFRINPNSVDNSIQLVGDEMRTLNGALISQPTGIRESYEVSSVFYQPRTRAMSEISLVADCIDWYNSKLYAINKSNNRIDVYNKNMIPELTITLAAVTNKNFRSLTVVSDGVWILSSNTGISDQITKINFSGTITVATKTLPIVGGQHIVSIEQLSGYLFAIRGGKIEQFNMPSLVKLSEISLSINGTMKGITSDGTYLVVGTNDFSFGNIIYHIDTLSGRTINSITSDELNLIDDLSYNGEYYYIYSSNKIQKIRGNTTMVDIFNLERQIVSYGFANLVDDIGVTNRVMISSISKDRELGYESMFNITLTVDKIDRG